MEILEYCRKAEIFDPSDDLICAAVVFRDSTGRIQLLVPMDFPLDPETVYNVLFYDPTSGLLRSTCKLSSPLKMSSGRLSIVCDIVSVEETMQRRQDLKVPVEVDVEATLLQAPPAAPPQDKGPFGGSTRNISAGGVYFVCQEAFTCGSVVQLKLTLSSKPLLLEARVIRQEELPPKKKKPQYGYGCQFINLKPQAEAELRSFTFRRERSLYQ